MFESSYSHLNFRFCDWFEQWVSWNSDNYRVRTHSETRMWRGKNIQSIKLLCNFIEITPWHGCSPVNLLLIFRTPFSKNTLWLSAYDLSPFFITFTCPSSGATCKNQRKQQAEINRKKRRDKRWHAWFILFSLQVQIFSNKEIAYNIWRQTQIYVIQTKYNVVLTSYSKDFKFFSHKLRH